MVRKIKNEYYNIYYTQGEEEERKKKKNYIIERINIWFTCYMERAITQKCHSRIYRIIFCVFELYEKLERRYEMSFIYIQLSDI